MREPAPERPDFRATDVCLPDLVPMSPRLAPLVLACTLAGCAAPSTNWVKEGVGPEELARDRAACARGSDDYRFLDERARRGATGGIESDLYRACMEARGWHRERASAPAPTRR